jgi:hypothetical protein
VSSDDEAMALLEKKAFDLVLIGRNGTVSIEEVDQRLRHRRPQQCILKIEDPAGGEGHFATRNTDADPRHVLAAVKELLGK